MKENIELLDVGEIVAPHGIKGEVRVYPLSDSQEVLLDFKKFYLDNLETILEVEYSKIHKNIVIIKFKGITDRNEVAKYLQKRIYVDRKEIKLEKNRVFIKDLIGMKIYDVDTNILYGELVNVVNRGGNDLYEIRNLKEKIFFVPAVSEFVKKINMKKRTILIRPIEGLIED